MITIRKAIQEEAHLIVGFQLNLAMETEGISLNLNRLQKGVAQVFASPEKGTYYVAVHENEVIASLLITFEWSDWRCGTVYWIQSVYVIPEFRGEGVFRKMYAHIKQVVEQSDEIVGIRLYVDKTNLNAQKVYDCVGMNGEHYQLYEWMKSP